jgi:uncharacterized protein (TIGR04255 family)
MPEPDPLPASSSATAPSSGSLVDFESPPVSEVALAVQFAEPVATDAVTLGQYWPLVREEYPHLQPQPPLAPIVEVFAGDGGQPRVTFQLMEGAVPSRYWFVSSDSSELIQVQPDRFAFNWRGEPAAGDPYPRYPYLRERFERLYTVLASSLEERGVAVVPTWVEVTYVNPIPAQADDGSRMDLSAILRRISSTRPASLPPVEETSLNEQYLLQREGRPYGRFRVAAAPVLRVTDGAPAYMLTLTARGQIETPDMAGILAFLDEGRSLIVNGFRDMTTDHMHEVWGLQ